MPKQPKFSLFASLSDRNPKTITLDAFAEMVRGGDFAEQVARVRNAPSKTARNAAKKKLPAVTVSGVFSGGHKKSDLKTHSGLICMDFDAQDNPALKDGGAVAVRDRLETDRYSRLAFISAGGSGLAVVCKIDPGKHAESFDRLEKYFLDEHGLVADGACRDVCRLRFVSWDSSAVSNPDAESCPVEYVEHIEESTYTTPSTASTTSTGQNVLTHSLQAGHFIARFENSPRFHLFRNLIQKKIAAKQGERNRTLTKKVVPFLHCAVAESVAMEFCEAFYWFHAGIFLDPISQHMDEARKAWKNCAAAYPASLNETEREFYAYLQTERNGDQLVTLFRICRGLAEVESDQFPAGKFALSAEQTKLRLGLDHDKQGRRLLDLIHKRYGIIELVAAGQARAQGKRGIANIYRWKLGAFD